MLRGYFLCFPNCLTVNGTVSRYIDNDNDYVVQLILQRVVIWSFLEYIKSFFIHISQFSIVIHVLETLGMEQWNISYTTHR